MKLYVGNLSFNTTNQDLNELFGTIGTVESSNIIEDRETGRSRGFGFVEMASQKTARRPSPSLTARKSTDASSRSTKLNPRATAVRGGGGGGGSRRLRRRR